MQCEGPDGTAEVAYTVLRWDDVVSRHFPRANGRRLVAAPLLWWRLVRCGHFAALRRVGRRFAIVILNVHLIFAGLVALAGLATAGLLALVELERWPGVAVAALAAALALALLTLAMAATRGRPFYVAHLVDDTAFTHRHAAARVPEMATRLDAFAGAIVAAVREADEVVVVGHSSGSFLSVEALARALDRAPALGTDGARVVLVTLGSVLPWIALDPAADRVRAALTRVAAAPFAWIDVLATWDWLSIHACDPLGAVGLPGQANRPVTLQVALGNLVDARTRRRTRYNLFQRHFQLLMASRHTRSFDYLALVTSPQPVEVFVESCRTAEEATLAGRRA